MHRRSFLTLLGTSAAAWPLAARAQQSQMPVIGYLSGGSPEASGVVAFRKGLSETGYIEGRNVAIEYRFAHNEPDRPAELAADLVRRRVAVIVALGGATARIVKAATTTIPIIFRGGNDPVRDGLVASLNRPGGNVTGVATMAGEIVTKRLGLLHELIPGAARVALLISPYTANADAVVREVKAGASAIGLQVEVLTASNSREIDAAFASLARVRADALLVSNALLFENRRVQLATLAVYNRVPAIYALREIAEAGGLMSYGASNTDEFRQVGIYAGRILKMLWGGGEEITSIVANANRWSLPNAKAERPEPMP
jgi:putative ABC transport system substrate-binding protein